MDDDKWDNFSEQLDLRFDEDDLHYLYELTASHKNINLIWNKMKDLLLDTANLIIEYKVVGRNKYKPKE